MPYTRAAGSVSSWLLMWLPCTFVLVVPT
jgi:hypothetical protein